jgi:hypothetical protein
VLCRGEGREEKVGLAKPLRRDIMEGQEAEEYRAERAFQQGAKEHLKILLHGCDRELIEDFVRKLYDQCEELFSDYEQEFHYTLQSMQNNSTVNGNAQISRFYWGRRFQDFAAWLG